MNGSPEVEIARLEMRADNTDTDIAELKVAIKEVRDEVGALRRFQAWLMGGMALAGGLITQFGSAILERLK